MKIPVRFNPMGYDADVSGGAVQGVRGTFLYWSNGLCAKSAMSMSSVTLVNNSISALVVSSAGYASNVRAMASASVDVKSGGSVSDCVLLSKCVARVSSGGVIAGISLLSASASAVADAGSIVYAVVSSGSAVAEKSGVAVSSLLSGGVLIARSGGSVVDTSVYAGSLIVSSGAVCDGISQFNSSGMAAQGSLATFLNVAISNGNYISVHSCTFPDGLPIEDGKLILANAESNFRYSSITLGTNGYIGGISCDTARTNYTSMTGVNKRLEGSPSFSIDHYSAVNVNVYNGYFANNCLVSNCVICNSCILSNFASAIDCSLISGGRLNMANFCYVDRLEIENGFLYAVGNCSAGTVVASGGSSFTMSMNACNMSSLSAVNSSNYASIVSCSITDISFSGVYDSVYAAGHSIDSMRISNALSSRADILSMTNVSMSCVSAEGMSRVSMNSCSASSIFVGNAMDAYASNCSIGDGGFVASNVSNVYIGSCSASVSLSSVYLLQISGMPLDSVDLQDTSYISAFACSGIHLPNCSNFYGISCDLSGAFISAQYNAYVVSAFNAVVAGVPVSAGSLAVVSGGFYSSCSFNADSIVSITGNAMVSSCLVSAPYVYFTLASVFEAEFPPGVSAIMYSSAFMNSCVVSSGAVCSMGSYCSGMTVSVLSGGSLLVNSRSWCSDVVSMAGAYCSGQSIYYR